jgi:hypothetical protein
MMAGPELMGIRAAARALGVHENTVRNWQKSGRLAAAGQDPPQFSADEVARVLSLTAGQDGRSLADEPMGGAEAAILVRLTLPSGMTPRQAVHEVAVGVSFGRPEVSLHYVRPGRPG